MTDLKERLMKKFMLLSFISLITHSSTFSATASHLELVTALSEETQERRNGGIYMTVAMVAGVAITSVVAFSERVTLETAVKTGCVAYGIYCLTWAYKMGHTFLAQWHFKRLYNKRINYSGELVKNLSAEGSHLPFALDDGQFIDFGYRSGFSTNELIFLAQKAGRIDLALRLKQGQLMDEYH